MITVKLTTPWNHDYYAQTPKGEGIFGEFKFEINNSCDNCDFWIVWGNLLHKEVVSCPAENIIYMVDEAHEKRIFNSNFLNQFSSILTIRKDLKHKRIIAIHELCPWYLKKNYEQIVETKINKTKLISVVCSDITYLPGHKKRFAFVNKLIGYFGDKIDVYGYGINPIYDKWDALCDYKYSIAIEHSSIPNYFSEKISECYLTQTMPIYHGCPNIYDYYIPESLVKIDIEDFNKSINIIESAFRQNLYEKNKKNIDHGKSLFMNKYHLFPALINIIEGNFNCKAKDKTKVILFPENYYFMKDEYNNLIYKTGVRKSFKLFLDTIKTKFYKD